MNYRTVKLEEIEKFAQFSERYSELFEILERASRKHRPAVRQDTRQVKVNTAGRNDILTRGVGPSTA